MQRLRETPAVLDVPTVPRQRHDQAAIELRLAGAEEATLVRGTPALVSAVRRYLDAPGLGRVVILERITGDGARLVVDPAAYDELRMDNPGLLTAFDATYICTCDSHGRLSAHGGGSPLVGGLSRRSMIIKRALDVVLGSLALLAAFPVLLAAVVAVRLDSSGPGLFCQERVGLNGRRFRLYKLRTMRTHNDSAQHEKFVRGQIEAAQRGESGDDRQFSKLIDDPRITRVGKWLRWLSIDELPQLWNVLKGDASLVGPRPPLPGEVASYDADTWQRLRVKPGLTGLWQVSGRSRVGFAEMVRLDVRYWQEWSLRQELKILARTPVAVLIERDTA